MTVQGIVKTSKNGSFVASGDVNLKKLITLITAVGLVAGAGGSWAMMKGTVADLKGAMSEHHADEVKHMPLDAKLEAFASRNEMDSMGGQIEKMDERQRSILHSVTRIEALLERESR